MSVIVSHIAFSTLAALVQISQVQFDTNAATADLRVSWVEFDTCFGLLAPPIVPAPVSGGHANLVLIAAALRRRRRRRDEEALAALGLM